MTINVNCPPRGLFIGRETENVARTLAVDFSAWAAEHGPGTLQVLLQRPGDSAPYPVTLTVEGTVATWKPSETDLAEAGTGAVQLVYTTAAGVREKTQIIPVMVEPSLGVESDPPEGWTSWIDQLTDLAAETEQHAIDAAESAENAAASAAGALQSATDAGSAKNAAVAAAEAAAASVSHYPQIVGGVWYVWSPTAGEYISTGIDAQGEDGVSPTVEITAIQGGHRVVITDADGPHTFDVLDGVTPDMSAYRTAADQDEIDDAQDEQIDDLKSALDTKAGIIRDTVNGAVASFVPDASVENLLGVSVDIEPVQAGSGDPSPDNVRPISGWDSVEVKRTGVNVGHIYGYSASNPASPTATLYTSNAYGTTISTTDGSADKIIVTQTDHSATQVINYRNGYISIGCDSLENGKAYWFSAKIKITSNPLNVNSTIALWNGLNGETLNISNGILSGRIGAIESGKRRFLEIRCCGASFELSDVMFTLVETADYHPYQGQSYQIQLGDTVYGGTLDVTNGTLTVDRAMVDLGTLSWVYLTSGSGLAPFFFANVRVNLIKYQGNFGTVVYNILCSMYKTTNRNSANFIDGAICADGNVGNQQVTQIQVKDSRYTDATSFKAAVTGQQLCYELATPIVIDLDPVTIAAIADQTNNVWADSGDVSVEFAADLKTYIDQKIAAAVAAMS